MSGKVEFFRLYERTSGAGNRYYGGKLNGLRLVAFPVEAKDGLDAHIAVYISTDEQRPEGGRSEAWERPAAGSYRGTQGGRRAGAGTGKPKQAEGNTNLRAPEFDDPLPF